MRRFALASSLIACVIGYILVVLGSTSCLGQAPPAATCPDVVALYADGDLPAPTPNPDWVTYASQCNPNPPRWELIYRGEDYEFLQNFGPTTASAFAVEDAPADVDSVVGVKVRLKARRIINDGTPGLPWDVTVALYQGPPSAGVALGSHTWSLTGFPDGEWGYTYWHELPLAMSPAQWAGVTMVLSAITNADDNNVNVSKVTLQLKYLH